MPGFMNNKDILLLADSEFALESPSLEPGAQASHSSFYDTILTFLFYLPGSNSCTSHDLEDV